VDAAIELIAERGVRDFSLAEISRRLGVTVAAPYRHFADRDDLLAAVGVRALHAFAAALAAETAQTQAPEQRLAAMARAYVRFAGEQRPLFDTVFSMGIDKSRYPEYRRAYEPVDEKFDSCVREICGGDSGAAGALAVAVEATAHGYATLLIDGSFGAGEDAIAAAAGLAASATLALIQGRQALRPPASRPPGSEPAGN
jgi:AcrR family transcriptional regulator